MAEADRRGDDGGSIAVRPCVHDERAVDLELIDGQSAQLRKRRMARAEVIDREANPGDAQQLHVARRELRIAHHRALGDLQDQGTGCHPRFLQQLQNLIPQGGVENVRRRQIDRDLYFHAFALPLAHLADGGSQYPTRELSGVTRSLRERHEFCG